MIGAAMQLVVKSAAKSVILFGRYLCSRRTHGKMGAGTSGVNAKMPGSQIAKTPRRKRVVIKISRMKHIQYPTVKAV